MRVLSYNIHKGIGGRDRLYRLERVIQVIEQENPDLICLQEVDRHVPRSEMDDQPRVLTRWFNAVTSLYQLNVKAQGGGYGNLLLSRWPSQRHHHISLRLHNRKPRARQLAAIDTPEGPMMLVNWHLGLAERERHWQAHHLLGHDSFLESTDLPALVIGDFNDWRNTLAAGPFARHGFQHVTAPPSRFRSFPAYLAVGSLDKAFIRGNIQVRHARVVRSTMSRAASDHLPLVIDFHLKQAAPHGVS